MTDIDSSLRLGIRIPLLPPYPKDKRKEPIKWPKREKERVPSQSLPIRRMRLRTLMCPPPRFRAHKRYPAGWLEGLITRGPGPGLASTYVHPCTCIGRGGPLLAKPRFLQIERERDFGLG